MYRIHIYKENRTGEISTHTGSEFQTVGVQIILSEEANCSIMQRAASRNK